MDINTIRNEKIDTLNEIIGITRDSAKFYSDASSAVPSPNLKKLFNEMATSKNDLVSALSREVKAEGATPEDSGTVRGKWDRWYGDMRAKFGDTDYGYVSQLESSEDRLMNAFQGVIKDDAVPAPVKKTVQEYLPTITAHHDLMRDRKWDMKTTH